MTADAGAPSERRRRRRRRKRPKDGTGTSGTGTSGTGTSGTGTSGTGTEQRQHSLRGDARATPADAHATRPASPGPTADDPAATLAALEDGWDLPSREMAVVPNSAVVDRRDEDDDEPLPAVPPPRPHDGEPDYFEDDEALLDGELVNIVSVEVGAAAPAEYDAGDLQLARGEHVVVETDRGLALGVVARLAQRRLVRHGPPRVLRRVGQEDPRLLRSSEREREAFDFCRERIRARTMPMKLIRAEYLQSGNKVLFYFAAENRVDFRDLVKDLARRLHARIEMRQVGVRDESRISAGIGPCGQQLCCSSWITSFHPVSIRMAKDQNIVLNPTKVSGMCGRLKCCLAYEQALYREARKSLPKVGQRVETPAGGGRVHEIDIPRGLVRVLVSDGSITTFSAKEVKRPEA